MIRDLASEFSTAQDVGSGGAATTVSTNVLDTQIAGGDAAVGTETRVCFEVTTAFANGTSCAFQLFTSGAEGFGTETKIFDSGAIPVATLVKGYQIKTKLPFGCLRYLRAKYVTVGATTAGSVTAGIVKEVDNWKPIDPVGYKF